MVPELGSARRDDARGQTSKVDVHRVFRKRTRVRVNAMNDRASARSNGEREDDGDDEKYVTYEELANESVPTAEFRLTCPDKTGLGADICRVVFEFGLVVTRGDFTTDGVWALVLLTARAGRAEVVRDFAGESECDGENERTRGVRGKATVSNRVLARIAGVIARAWSRWRMFESAGARRATERTSSSKIRVFDSSGHGGNAAAKALETRTCVVDWELLRQRLELLCPHKSTISTIPSSDSLHLLELQNQQQSLYILQVEVDDRVGLLHDVTLALWELQLTVHRAHVTTSPSGMAVDLFYVTDDLHELPNPARVGDISRHVKAVAAATPAAARRANILVHPAPGFVTRQGRAKALRSTEDMEVIIGEGPEFSFETTVEVDNLMSPAHTVFQIRTRDRQGLLYDALRVSKDLKVSVSYAKIEIIEGGICEIALFTRNIASEAQTDYLCSRYKEHVDRPIVVQMLATPVDNLTSELRVFAPLDIGGYTRPRVLLNVTEALQDLAVMVFKADILIDPRTVDQPIQEEVHRFVLTESSGEPISDAARRQLVCDRVINALLR